MQLCKPSLFTLTDLGSTGRYIDPHLYHRIHHRDWARVWETDGFVGRQKCSKCKFDMHSALETNVEMPGQWTDSESISYENLSWVPDCSQSSPDCKQKTSDSQKTPKFQILFYIDAACVSFFSIDLIVKFMTWPNRIDFFKELLNWCDMIAVGPFYIQVEYLFVTTL